MTASWTVTALRHLHAIRSASCAFLVRKGKFMGPIDQLSVAERLDLINQLWDSIPDSPEALPVPEWHREEIERRLAAADAAPASSIPWEQVRDELRGEP